jgi:Ca2+-binding RTX toxin-like protein
MIVAGQYQGTGIERIEFDGGYAWGQAEIANATWLHNGTSADEALYGGAGNDVFDGKGGNDFLPGEQGSDTYVLTVGGGSDVVFETAGYGDIDTVRVQGLGPELTHLRRVGDDLVVGLASGEQMIVAGQYQGTGIERIEFDGGYAWGQAEIDSLVQAMAAFAPIESGQTTLQTEYHDPLALVIAAS